MKKRRLKPKVLLLSSVSPRSVARLKAALAFTGSEVPEDYKLTRRAEAMLRLLREMA